MSMAALFGAVKFVKNEHFDASQFSLESLGEDGSHRLTRDSIDRGIQFLKELMEVKSLGGSGRLKRDKCVGD